MYLYQTDLYALQTGEGQWDSVCKGFPVYKLVNLVTGIVEGEGLSLPDAIIFMLQRTLALREAYEQIEMFAAPEGPVH